MQSQDAFCNGVGMLQDCYTLFAAKSGCKQSGTLRPMFTRAEHTNLLQKCLAGHLYDLCLSLGVTDCASICNNLRSITDLQDLFSSYICGLAMSRPTVSIRIMH